MLVDRLTGRLLGWLRLSPRLLLCGRLLLLLCGRLRLPDRLPIGVNATLPLSSPPPPKPEPEGTTDVEVDAPSTASSYAGGTSPATLSSPLTNLANCKLRSISVATLSADSAALPTCGLSPAACPPAPLPLPLAPPVPFAAGFGTPFELDACRWSAPSPPIILSGIA